MRTRRMRRCSAMAVALVALLGVGACGDDDETSAENQEDTSSETTGTSGDLDAYCEATFALETAPPPDIDFESATPDEIAAGLKEYAGDTMVPLAEDVVANAPEDLADDIAVLKDALDEMAATGDFAVFDRPEAAAASDRAHSYDVNNCGWSPVEATAKDYSFEGLPAEVPAGITSFELTNEGSEPHEIAIFRKNDGVTESVEELLALPEEEAMTKATMIAIGEPVGSGEDTYAVVDLEAGDYFAVCFIPVGTTDLESAPADAPPHFTMGMVSSFTVT